MLVVSQSPQKGFYYSNMTYLMSFINISTVFYNHNTQSSILIYLCFSGYMFLFLFCPHGKICNENIIVYSLFRFPFME